MRQFASVEDFYLFLDSNVENSYFMYMFGSMMYSQCGHIFAPKDYDFAIIVDPNASTNLEYSDILEDVVISGLNCDFKTTTLDSLDADELILLIHAMDESKYHTNYSTAEVDLLHKKVVGKLSDKSFIRSQISRKCSNSLVKAKKKLIIKKDYNKYISFKSAFHSIRMAMYATTYCSTGRVDTTGIGDVYQKVNCVYNSNTNDIVKSLVEGDIKTLYNKTMSNFRQVCPK